MTEQPQPADLTQVEPETAFDGLEVDAPRVGIIMGSKSDMPEMEKAGAVLEELGVSFEIRVMSAHRDPDVVADYCRNARMRGLRVIIAGAGLSAALPGVAAAHSDLPVIGVPLSSRLSAAGGLDAGVGADGHLGGLIERREGPLEHLIGRGDDLVAARGIRFRLRLGLELLELGL